MNQTKPKKNKVIIILALLAAVAIPTYIMMSNAAKANAAKDAFAKCITEQGAVMYGAFWCPHCANQKKLFGKSFNYIEYIECSLPDRSGQFPVCIEAQIKSYPTWEFNDRSRLSGELSLGTLSQKTGCALPA